jgi:hypothetical protein
MLNEFVSSFDVARCPLRVAQKYQCSVMCQELEKGKDEQNLDWRSMGR